MAGKTLIYQFFGGGTSKTITVPRGYSKQVIAYVWGAGGGAGTGANGAGGGFTAGIIDVDPDSQLTITVGGQGTAGQGYRPAGVGGLSNNPFINMSGGDGGLAGDEDGDSGSGGGGGAASAIFVDGIPVLVAAGGGGGGGYGDDGAGGATAGTPGGVATRVNTLPRGEKGSNGGGGAGGGGGGYPKGGATGIAYGDDNRGSEGGYGGQNYANTSIVSDSIIENGSGIQPGGLRLNGNTNPYWPKRQRGFANAPGAVILIFVKSFQAWIKDSGDWKQITQGWIKSAPTYVTPTHGATPVLIDEGGWKQITRAWMKHDDNWNPIETSAELIPIQAPESPTTYQEVNIVIASDVNNYSLADYLDGSGYFPGKTIINLTVNSGVVVSSSSPGTPAMIIGGLKTGDVVNLINNGYIVGKGGTGGAGGEYSSGGIGGTTYCFLPGTKISTPNGLINIEDIKKGDLVNSYDIGADLNNSAPLEVKPVTEIYEHAWDGITSPLVIINYQGGQLITTEEHEILCKDKVDTESDYVGFVKAVNLEPGDIIYNTDGEELVIESVTPGPEYEYVYNFEVKDFHTFIADGVRVHNGTTPIIYGGGSGKNIPGRPGGIGGTGLELTFATNIFNNGTIAGGGGGGGGGGASTGGQGGGGAGYGSGANNGTLTAPGAGTGLGGTGGALGSAGAGGGSGSQNAGGAGGRAGFAMLGRENASIQTVGTISGPIKYENSGVIVWSTGSSI